MITIWDDTFYDSVRVFPVKTPRLATVYRHCGRDWQDAESIFFIHGSLSSGRWWEPAMAAFDELMPGKYACYAPDLRSHGDAEPAPVQGMESFTLDCLSVMDAIGLKKAHVVGWSMGAGPAMQLAFDHPDRCLSLTLVSPLPPFGTESDYLPHNRAFIGQAIRQGNFEAVNRIIRASNLRTGRFPLDNSPPGNALFYYLLQSAMQIANYPGDEQNGEGDSAAMHLFNMAARCPGISIPVLAIHGDEDAIISNELFARMNSLWPSGKYQEVVFKGASHSPMVEQPRRFAITLDEFFSTI